MGRIKLKRAIGEDGLTLVEVLVSFVLLTMLLTTFLMMFLQSTKANKTSENVINDTYIAQSTMEKMYAFSENTLYSKREEILLNPSVGGYTKKSNQNGWMVFEKDDVDTNDLIKVRLKNRTGTMDRVIVEVYEMPEKTLRAKMENVLVWKEVK